MVFRAWTHRRRVPGSSHDGDVGPRLIQECQGTLEFDPADPRELSVETTIKASTCWTGVDARDRHLRSPDFLDCERFPDIASRARPPKRSVRSTIESPATSPFADATRPVTLGVRYLGSWQTPWWEDGVDKGPKTRAGFVARTQIDRYDFGVNWNDTMPDGGVVVSPQSGHRDRRRGDSRVINPHARLLLQNLMHERDRDRAFADGRSHTLDASFATSPTAKTPGKTALEQIRRPQEGPARRAQIVRRRASARS